VCYDEWIALGVFDQLARITGDAYDRIVGLLLEDVAVDAPPPKPVGAENGVTTSDQRLRGPPASRDGLQPKRVHRSPARVDHPDPGYHDLHRG
jgi:hypothetical protein